MAEPTPPVTAAPGELVARAPGGQWGTIPAAQADAATAQGYEVESPQETAVRLEGEKEGNVGAAKAFAENAASTATLGLSDVALGAVGGNEYRTSRALREQAYPLAGTAGEVAGMVGPALLTGGESLAAEGAAGAAEAGEAAEAGSALSRGAQAVANVTPSNWVARGGHAVSELVGRGLEAAGYQGESALGRLGASALQGGAGGAFEGAAFGAGHALSEAALAPDGDYDGLAQKLLAGSLEGAEFGGLVGGGIGLGGRAIAETSRKLGGTFSAREALDEFAADKTITGATGARPSDLKSMNLERKLELAGRLRNMDEIGVLDTPSEVATTLREAKGNTGELLGTMRKQLDEVAGPGDLPDVRAVLEKADTQATADMLAAKTPGKQAQIARFADELDGIRKNIGDQPLTFEQSHELRRELDDTLTNYGRKEYPASGRNRPPDLFEQQMRSLRGDLENEFENAADKLVASKQVGSPGETAPIDQGFGDAYRDAKTRYGALKELSGIAKKRSQMGGALRKSSLIDSLIGAGGIAHFGAPGMLLAGVSKLARSSQADRMIGKMAYDLSSMNRRIQGSVGRWLNSGAKATEHGAIGGIAIAEGGGAGLEETLKQIGESAGKTLHSSADVGKDYLQQKRDYYDEVDRARRESMAPAGTLMPEVAEAPRIAQALERTKQSDAKYLYDQAPIKQPPMDNPILARLARQRNPRPEEVRDWNKKKDIIEDPLSALPKLERNRLTVSEVQALEARRPAVLQQMRDAVLKRIAENAEDVSYAHRLQMGVLLGVVTDPSLRPESIRAGQAIYAKQKQATAQQPKQSAPGRMPQNMSSRVDELEMGVGEQ